MFPDRGLPLRRKPNAVDVRSIKTELPLKWGVFENPPDMIWWISFYLFRYWVD